MFRFPAMLFSPGALLPKTVPDLFFETGLLFLPTVMKSFSSHVLDDTRKKVEGTDVDAS